MAAALLRSGASLLRSSARTAPAFTRTTASLVESTVVGSLNLTGEADPTKSLNTPPLKIDPAPLEEANLSAVLHGINDLRLDNLPMPVPKPHEVLIKMQQVGICGSDVHYWTHGHIGKFVLRSPMTLGHESSGRVVACGAEVTSLKPGDRVAIEPGVPCMHCEPCWHGRYNLCPEIEFCATPPVGGSLSKYYTHSAKFCYKLPPHVTYEEGALLEPLSVGMHAIRRAAVALGHVVLITGAGPIGLTAMMLARVAGAGKIIMTDLDEARLAKALELGADGAVKVSLNDSDQVTAEKIIEAAGGKVDKVVECSGAGSSLRQGIYASKPGGCVVIVGHSADHITIPITHAGIHEIDIRGIFRYAHTYQALLNLITARRIDVRPLITHRFILEDTMEAFETAKTGRDGAIKVMIACNVD